MIKAIRVPDLRVESGWRKQEQNKQILPSVARRTSLAILTLTSEKGVYLGFLELNKSVIFEPLLYSNLLQE